MVKVIFYTKKNERREALFNITEDNGLELYSLKTLDDTNSLEYKQFISKKIDIVKQKEQLVSDIKIGIGDLIYYITSKFGIKHCSKCNQRKNCFNILTPIFISKILTFVVKYYNGKTKNKK